MVIFKELFSQRDKFNGSEAIVYSTLVYKSISMVGDLFDEKGHLMTEYIEDHLENVYDKYISCCWYSVSKLANDTNMSIRNIKYILNKLKDIDYISGDEIYAPYSLIKKGYLTIPSDTDLSGWQLVFYAFLKERCDYFGGSIDTWSSRLAELFGTTSDNIRKLISILTQKGYITRNDSGNLTINIRERIKPDSPPLAKVIPNYKEYACKDNAFY